MWIKAPLVEKDFEKSPADDENTGSNDQESEASSLSFNISKEFDKLEVEDVIWVNTA
jgi:hypothetical protein